MSRQKIGMNTSPMEMMTTMSEGNPGALSIIIDIAKKNPAMYFIDLLHLDDMNIWGSQIWVGFKDHCGGDMDKFLKCVGDRDKEMVNTINRESGSVEVAVTSGASFNR